MNILNYVIKFCHFTGLDKPKGLQNIKLPEFLYSQHMKVVKLSAPSTGRLYTQEISLIPIYVRGSVDLGDIVRLERLCQWKIAMTPSGIEHATFRLVAQCLNQLRYRVPQIAW
jgi:hypothetical protein